MKSPRAPRSAGANRPSSIDRLPGEIRDAIAALRREGRTIDEIKANLDQLKVDVSRSALGRHVRTLADIGEDMRRTEAMAKFVVERFGDEPDDRVGRANMRILQGVLFDLINAERLDDDGERVTISIDEAKQLALAVQRLQSAQHQDAERQLKMRREFAKEQADKLEGAVASGQINAEAAARARQILGFG